MYESATSIESYDTNEPMRLIDREHIKLSYSKQATPSHGVKVQYYYDQSDLSEYHETMLNPLFYNQLFGGSSAVAVYDSYMVDLQETRQDIELQST